MISTKGLQDGDLCFIWIGYEDSDEDDSLAKLRARFKNGKFITEGNGWINTSIVHDGIIFASSVVKFKKIRCTKHCDYSNDKKKCAAVNHPVAELRGMSREGHG